MNKEVDFAAYSRAWRRRMGLTRAEGAKLLGLPRRSLEGWELGRPPRYPRPIILAMRLLLGVREKRPTS